MTRLDATNVRKNAFGSRTGPDIWNDGDDATYASMAKYDDLTWGDLDALAAGVAPVGFKAHVRARALTSGGADLDVYLNKVTGFGGGILLGFSGDQAGTPPSGYLPAWQIGSTAFANYAFTALDGDFAYAGTTLSSVAASLASDRVALTMVPRDSSASGVQVSEAWLEVLLAGQLHAALGPVKTRWYPHD